MTAEATGKPAKGTKGAKRRTYTPAQTAAYKERKRKETAEAMETAATALLTSEGWMRWVRCRARFHKYSWSNTMLIAWQCPEATYVTAYRKWPDLKRQVRHGEKAIQIFAPLFRKEQDEKGVERQVLYGFKLVPVFDVSQTEGEPLPIPEMAPITGESHMDYIPKLVALAESLDYTVTWEELHGRCGGYCDPLLKRIVIESEGDPNAHVRVLIHEIAHALGVGYKDYGRQAAEVIVETVTYIVCTSIGLDTSDSSVPYVASWGAADKVKAIQTFAEVVDKVARQIEKAVA